SDALLGIFDAIAPAAAAALGALTRGDTKTFHDILAPTVPLSRHIFKAPTRFYKTGVVFMAYLNGLQHHFTLVGGQESARSTLHLAELFRLADAAGLIADPDRAALRMRAVLATRGVEASWVHEGSSGCLPPCPDLQPHASPAGLTRGSIFFARRWIAPQLGLARVAQYYAPQVG